jgi:ANTAR domain-containing protein/GAF domain-containing protein
VQLDRAARLRGLLDAGGSGGRDPARLCAVCVEVLPITGAGLSLITESGHVGTIAASSPVTARVDELQFTLGEGPCVEAFQLGGPVLEPDLAAATVARWPGFAPAAIGAGVRAAFAFPLQVGAFRIGALNLFRDSPGSLTADEIADALLLADVATRILLDLGAESAAGEVPAGLDDPALWQAEVHQATGMIMAQLRVRVDEAFVRLRAHAYATNRPLGEVAADVVARRLRLDGEDRGDQ